MSSVTKAVIPVAGFGTRFLPATKAQPKEMLPLVDKPIIQYIVEEAVAAGIKEIIFVTSQTKRAIEDHFDRNFELEYRLKQQKKDDLLKEISHIFKLAQFVYVRQPTPRGWGDALLQTEHIINQNPFAVFLGDDIIDSSRPAIAQLMEVYDRYQATVVGVTEVKKDQVSRYGIVAGKEVSPRILQLQRYIEKPPVAQAPSTTAVTGRYIFTPDIFHFLHQLKPEKNGEINTAKALAAMLKQRPVYACRYTGTYYDCGNKLDYLKATIAFGLKHPELKKPLKAWLKQQK